MKPPCASKTQLSEVVRYDRILTYQLKSTSLLTTPLETNQRATRVKRSAQSTFALRPILVIKSRPPTTAQFVVRKSWDYLNGVLCFTLSGAHSLAAAQIATGLDLAGVRADVTPRLQHVSFVNTPWCTRMMHSRKSKTFIQSL
ncbi:hypothetical protein RRG08_052602 [Elysia crispata]|uniref:Uncharacterized protein n=1 Tax=Elysia crispata TaxID=231223 RepID=A0AAE1A1K5_9GAST|nr:hypothetical protein RRG08_052602 [Elysia crispata]